MAHLRRMREARKERGRGSPKVFLVTFDLQEGGIAQLVERLPCTQEVSGSSPLTSTESDRKCFESVLNFQSCDPLATSLVNVID